MTVHNWDRCWMASVFHALQGVDDHAPAQIDLLPTKAIAIPAVAACCVSGRSRIPFLSDVTSRRNGRLGQVARSFLTRLSMPVATSSSVASIGSSSGVG